MSEATDSDTDFANAVIKNAFDLWFRPEVERRTAAGELPSGFALWGAQVIQGSDARSIASAPGDPPAATSRFVEICHWGDGKVVEEWFIVDDQAVSDEFWS